MAICSSTIKHTGEKPYNVTDRCCLPAGHYGVHIGERYKVGFNVMHRVWIPARMSAPNYKYIKDGKKMIGCIPDDFSLIKDEIMGVMQTHREKYFWE